MRSLVFDETLLRRTINEMASLQFMGELTPEHYKHMADEGLIEVVQFDPGGIVVRQGDTTESFFIVIAGSAVIRRGPSIKCSWTIGRIGHLETCGEVAMIDGAAQQTTVLAQSELLLLRFSQDAFQTLYNKSVEFKIALESIADARRQEYLDSLELPCREAAAKVPRHVMQRHQVMPIRQEGQILITGFVGESSPGLMMRLKAHMPAGVNVAPLQIERDYFEASLQYLLTLEQQDVEEHTSQVAMSTLQEKSVGQVDAKPVPISADEAADDEGFADDETSRSRPDTESGADDETAMGTGSVSAGLAGISVGNSLNQPSSEADLWSDVSDASDGRPIAVAAEPSSVPSIDEFVIADSVSDAAGGSDPLSEDDVAAAAATTLPPAAPFQAFNITEELNHLASRLRPREERGRVGAKLESLLEALNGSCHRRLTLCSSAQAFVVDLLADGAPEFHQEFSEADILGFVDPLLLPEGIARFKRLGHIRFCADGLKGRFLGAMSREHRGLRVTFQLVPTLSGFEDVCGVGPQVESQFAPKSDGGLVLVGGDLHARSLLLTALSSRAVESSSRNAISLEDPIEVLVDPKLLQVSQRELGGDFPTFHDGFRGALGESPSVLWTTQELTVPWLRELLRHTHSGLLAYGCFPGIRSSELLLRLASLLSSDPGVRDALSQDLRGVICPRLCHAVDGSAVLACDYLVPNQTLREMLSAGTLSQVENISAEHCQDLLRLDEALKKMAESEKISWSEAQGMSRSKAHWSP